MKKNILLLCVVASILAGSCGNKYSDVVKSLENQINIMNRFSGAVEKAGTPAGIASALEGFNADMTAHIPEARRIQEAYPELQQPESLPPEVTDNFEKLSIAAERFEAAMTRARQFKEDPAVLKGLRELVNIMGVDVPDAGGDIRLFSAP